MSAETVILILSVLFAISEALSMIPQVKENGVFQIIYSVLKIAAGKGAKK